MEIWNRYDVIPGKGAAAKDASRVRGIAVVTRLEALPAFSDPASVKEIYVEEIGDIQIVGGNLKVTLVVSREFGDGPERVAVTRIVVPIVNVPVALSQVISVLMGKPFMGTAIRPDGLPN